MRWYLSNERLGNVEAYTASWIEMLCPVYFCFNARVEAYTASWIEIYNWHITLPGSTSRLIQPRGLKYHCGDDRSEYSVEAYTASWIEINCQSILLPTQMVEAYTASWIEIVMNSFCSCLTCVEAYTASWIEMVEKADVESLNTSRLI